MNDTNTGGDAAAAPGRKKINPEIFWLIVIFLLAVSLRTIAVFTRDMILLDEPTYARMAENLLLGHAPLDITGTSATHFSILYPLITASFAVLGHNYVAAGYAVNVVFGSLIILPTYMFGKVMWNNRVATAAAALVAVLPVMVNLGTLVDGQNMFAFWLMCGIFFGYRMQFTKRCLCGMLSGTSLGLAYLDSPTALYYIVTLFVLLVIVGFRQELASYANKAAVQFLVMVLVFAIPNIVYMSYETSSFKVNDRLNDQVYASVNNLQTGTIERESDMYALDADGNLRLTQLQQGPGLIQTAVEQPIAFAKTTVRNCYNYYFRGIQSLIPVWLLPLIGLGMFKLVWTRRESLKYGYFAIVLLPLVILPVAWGDVRFVLPFMGIFMLLVARGWVFMEDWTAETVKSIAGWKELTDRHKTRVKQVLAVLVLAPLAALSLWTVARTDYPLEYRAAGEWLMTHGGGDVRVMSREPSSAWYSGGTQVVLPYASVEETVDYGRRNDAEFILLQREIVDNLRPQLVGLMEPAAVSPGLTEVYRQGEGTPSEVVIYRINQGG